ncbi:MAG: hypothetical protein PHX81_07335, partial [Eubacteriales bacterium]|nr:hypothetical protein [Eubacteriales bacterium]
RVFHDIPARIVGLKRVGFPAWQVKSRQKAADQQLLHAPDAKSNGNYTISIVRNLGKLLIHQVCFMWLLSTGGQHGDIPTDDDCQIPAHVH